MACAEIWKLVSCVGFSRRHAAKMQLPVVKEHLTKALCLLTSNSNETILWATPSSIKSSTPSTASQMASLRTDLFALLVAIVHQTCSVAVSDAVSRQWPGRAAECIASTFWQHESSNCPSRAKACKTGGRPWFGQRFDKTEEMLLDTPGPSLWSPSDPDIVTGNNDQQLILRQTRCPSRKRHLELQDAEFEQTNASSSHGPPECE